jgi:hypothetical protein
MMGVGWTVDHTQSIRSEVLTSSMAGIGMGFAAYPAPEPNIEDTIVFASIEGLKNYDLGLLAVLVTWFGIYASWVNADDLTKIAKDQGSLGFGRFGPLWPAGRRKIDDSPVSSICMPESAST